MRWNMDPVLIDLGFISLRWYGLFFATGVLLGARAMPVYLERYKLPSKYAGQLTVWGIVGMIVLAHLIHLIFYEPRSFIDNPRRIIEIGKGLASHGGGLGVFLAVYLFSRKKKVPFHRLLDPLVGSALWVIPMVRIGNFFNSEIYGRETDLPWGVIFVRRGFTVARHPSQLYEAAVGFLLLGSWLWMHKRYREKLAPGASFYTMMAGYFITRILIEWVKEYQAVHPSFPFTMGQMLSMPIVLACLGMLFFSKQHGFKGSADLTPIVDEEQPKAPAKKRPEPKAPVDKRERNKRRRDKKKKRR
jgi:phosphatidylglycerol:prolipoprotein diacylglycerol transferase